MATAIYVPRINNNDDEVKVLAFDVAIGSKVENGQIVGQVETDKAVLDVTAAAAGFVLGFVANPDEVVKVGSVMLWLGENVDEAIPEPQETSLLRSTAKNSEITAKARLLGWLQDHQETLPALDTTLPQWKPKAPLRAALKPLAPSPALPVLASDEVGGVATVQGPELRLRLAPAPLELLLVPDELDGRDGLFRADGVNVLNAGNDLQAIAGFLARFASSDKLRTLEAYRREVERFYSWCLSVREVALSSVTQADALAYQAFLANIPASWIHHKPTTRDADDWTPFRGQLHPRSQNYALGVVKSLFSYLWKIGYLRADAFDGLLPRNDGKVATPMDTTRALHPLDLEEVARAIEVMKARTFKNKEGQTEGVSSREAISHRNQFLVHLALTTGMRLAEIASASLATARHAIVDDVETDTIVIEIVGKGERKREVTLIPSAMTMLQEHHRHVAELLKEHPARLEAFQRSLPLVVALEAAVASPSRAISDDGAMLAHDDCGLSRAGILAVVKRFFAQVAKGCDDHARRERLAKVSTHWLKWETSLTSP